MTGNVDMQKPKRKRVTANKKPSVWLKPLEPSEEVLLNLRRWSATTDYWVADNGTVWKGEPGNLYPMTPLATSPNGGLGIWLTLSPGVQRCYSLARLVLMAFDGGPPLPQLVAKHRNGDVQDNRLVNLYWGRGGRPRKHPVLPFVRLLPPPLLGNISLPKRSPGPGAG